MTIQQTNSDCRVVCASPELQPPQLLIDCGVGIHLRRLLLDLRRNVAATSKTRFPSVSGVPGTPLQRGRERRIMDELSGSHPQTRSCVASGTAPPVVPPNPSYPATRFCVDPSRHRVRSETPLCAPPPKSPNPGSKRSLEAHSFHPFTPAKKSITK